MHPVQLYIYPRLFVCSIRKHIIIVILVFILCSSQDSALQSLRRVVRVQTDTSLHFSQEQQDLETKGIWYWNNNTSLTNLTLWQQANSFFVASGSPIPCHDFGFFQLGNLATSQSIISGEVSCCSLQPGVVWWPSFQEEVECRQKLAVSKTSTLLHS